MEQKKITPAIKLPHALEMTVSKIYGIAKTQKMLATSENFPAYHRDIKMWDSCQFIALQGIVRLGESQPQRGRILIDAETEMENGKGLVEQSLVGFSALEWLDLRWNDPAKYPLSPLRAGKISILEM